MPHLALESSSPGDSKDQWNPPRIEAGILTLYQFYDIGDEIDLDRAQGCLATPTTRRHLPVQVRKSERIEISELPVRIELEHIQVDLTGICFTGKLHASIYDLGAVALIMELSLPHALDWATVADLFAPGQLLPEEMQAIFLNTLNELENWIHPAIKRPQRSAVVEDYTVLLVQQLSDQANCAIETLADHPTVRSALLGEQQTLSDSMATMITAMSYFPNDLALLSWNGALLIEQDPLAAATAVDLIEFANIELLVMRVYDAELDQQLPQMYRRIAHPPARFTLPLVRSYSVLLHDVQRLVADVTEVTERVDNAFKVTDDVYWNRLYSAMLTVLRVHVWRTSVEQRLALLRETYSLLHNEADAERAAALEWAVVLLIVFEIVMALLGH